MKVLSVDDDSVNSTVMGGILSRLRNRGMDIECTICKSGMDALRLCLGCRYDVVFMDIMMPEMNGVEAVKAMREIYVKRGWEQPLVVMVTACDKQEARGVVKDIGVVGYIRKPYETATVAKWLQMCMSRGIIDDSYDKLGQ